MSIPRIAHLLSKKQKIALTLAHGDKILEGVFKAKMIHDGPIKKPNPLNPKEMLDVWPGDEYKKHQEYTFPYKVIHRKGSVLGPEDTYMDSKGDQIDVRWFEEISAYCHDYDPDAFTNEPIN